MKALTLMAALACSALFAVSAKATELSAEDLLAKWAQASGGAENIAQIKNVYTKYKVSTAGMEGEVETWTTSEGQSRQELKLGELYQTLTIFDGQAGWLLDHNEKVQAMEGSTLRDAMTDAYFNSFSHFVSGRRRASTESLGPDSTGALQLRITPEGGEPVTLFLDANSFETLRQERPADDLTEVTWFSDMRDVDGVRWPGKVRVSTGDPQYDVHLEALEIRTNVELPAAAFEPPTDSKSDFKFSEGNAALGIPMELNANHIYVKAQVNHGEWLWFIFDTGAGVTVMDRSRAESLGLPLEGKLQGRGAGEGTVDVSLIPKATFTLPGVELIDQTIMAMALGMVSPYEGRAVDGILGYDLISRFVVRIDYAAGRIDLLEPKSFSYSGSGQRLSLVMEEGHPHVSAELLVGGKRVRGHFLIDTGARTALHLSRPFCEENQLADAVPTIAGGFSAGVGGETKQRIGRVAELKLGDLVLKDVVTGFSEDQKGAGASRDESGIIGGDALRQFTVIFDYSRNEMILEPNAAFGQPFEYDMCGAFLRMTDDFKAIEIHRIVENSPAIEAGLKEGDQIISVDGRPVKNLTLEQIRAQLRTPGQKVRIRYERDRVVAETTLTTKRLI